MGQRFFYEENCCPFLYFFIKGKVSNILDDEQLKNGTKIAMKVSKVSIFINMLLFIIKLMAGILANSGAMISDAIHSASDVFSTFIVIIGVKIGGQNIDEKHQYGHEKLECIVAIFLAVLLGLTGLGIGYEGIGRIEKALSGDLPDPGILALIAAMLSILVKEWMYWYTRNSAKKINSPSLMADAWHHRSDAFSSIGSLIGIGGSIIGFRILDPLAAIIIAIIILKVSYDIAKDAVEKIVDVSCDEKIVEEIKRLTLEEVGVKGIDSLKTRIFGAKFYIDLEISVDGNISLSEAHTIAERVHTKIEESFSDAKHCMVHVNPEY